MDLGLKEVTWIRLLSLLLWTLLMMLKRGITQLIDVVERRVFNVSAPVTSERDQEDVYGEATLLPPLSDSIIVWRWRKCALIVEEFVH